MRARDRRDWSGCLRLVIGPLAVLALVVIYALIPPPESFRSTLYLENQAATMENCRQILLALKRYAGDHDGTFPDAHPSGPSTSNEAFRILIREGVLDNERVFGAKQSKYYPDNDIGGSPAFTETLEAGENHWAMTKGVTAKSIPKFPLVFENPAQAGWPPAWNCDAAGTKEKGRGWRGGKIIVGFNDGTVELVQLESIKGNRVLPARDSNGKDAFTRAGDRIELLDILE